MILDRVTLSEYERGYYDAIDYLQSRLVDMEKDFDGKCGLEFR